MRVDLHVHTTASDGAWTPEQVVWGAVEGGLDVLAVADHDTVASVAAAIRAARSHELRVVPATELSSTREGREIHVLGLFVDPTAPVLGAHQDRARSVRMERMERMLGRLRGEGVDVAMDAVLEAAGPRRDVVGRPHLARAMVRAGYVASVPEAFDRYIGDQHAAFVPTALLDPTEAVAVILECGGIPVWAHPPQDLLDSLLPDLVKAGLRGLEVYRPGTRPAQVQRLRNVAKTAGLLPSGGSDWHDPERNDPLGSFWVGPEEIGALLEAGGL